ncbi:MAG TPA: HTTM domain-containing protein [Acidimicrobiales bacterium]|nr:HTTM domain-containing protein [Acidimicrobiales bacterium]
MLSDVLHRVVRSRVNPRPVALLRTVFGALVLLRAAYFAEQARMATDAGLFTVAGSHLPGAGVGLLAVWIALGGALMVGWRSRSAAAAYAALVFALLAADPLFYNNHLYLMGLVAGLLACADCGAAFSLDARHRQRVTQVPGWPVFLLRAQVSITYAFAALSKLQEDFLSGLVLHVHLSRGPFAPLLPGWFVSNFVVLMSVAVAVIAAEVTLAWALWHPRWQNAAFTVGLLLHAPMVLLANSWHQALRLFVFSVLMWGLYLMFIRIPVAGRTLRWDPTNPTAAAAARVCQRLDWLKAVSFVPNERALTCLAGTVGPHVEQPEHAVDTGAATVARQTSGQSDARRPQGQGSAEGAERARPSLELCDLDGSAYTGFQALQRVLTVMPVCYLWASVLAHPLVRRWGDSALSPDLA